MIYIIVGIVCLVIGYFIGSNNPLPSVKAKIIAKAKETAAGL
jgi:hypothetical protein